MQKQSSLSPRLPFAAYSYTEQTSDYSYPGASCFTTNFKNCVNRSDEFLNSWRRRKVTGELKNTDLSPVLIIFILRLLLLPIHYRSKS